VEERIRYGKDTGLGRFPSRQFNVNAAWLELALTAADVMAWPRPPCCTAYWPRPNRKRCATDLLHVAARIIRGGRRVFVRIAEHWPWRHELAAAFARLAALPQPLRT
jgi:hypothetical protein